MIVQKEGSRREIARNPFPNMLTRLPRVARRLRGPVAALSAGSATSYAYMRGAEDEYLAFRRSSCQKCTIPRPSGRFGDSIRAAF